MSRARFGLATLGPVFVGGAAGTGLRAALSSAFAAPAGTFPWVTFWINIAGALLLGALVEALGRQGSRRWTRTARLGLGTGLLGGFTTYSSFVVESVLLGGRGHLLTGAAYDAVSLVAGFVAAFAGVRLAKALVPEPTRAEAAL